MKVKVGDLIRIDHMDGEDDYEGRFGTVTSIDDIGQIHGTWGGCAVCEDYGDRFTVIPHCPYEDKRCGMHGQCLECPCEC